MQNKNVHYKYNFYIFFPAGYNNRVSNITEDVIDIYIVSKSDFSKVYVGTLYTIQLIKKIFDEGALFAVEENMVIIIDLQKQTIYETISEIFKEGRVEKVFSDIGNYIRVFETTEIRNDLL